MSDIDLTSLLRSWPYEPGRICARRIAGDDDRPKLQVRLDLGLLQMEMQGRPDGLRPEGFESLLAFQQDRLERYTKEVGGPEGFVFGADEARALREEAVQHYHRYVGLFSLGDFEGVIRDTTRNLEVFDLCREYAAEETDRTVLEQFRPYERGPARLRSIAAGGRRRT